MCYDFTAPGRVFGGKAKKGGGSGPNYEREDALREATWDHELKLAKINKGIVDDPYPQVDTGRPGWYNKANQPTRAPQPARAPSPWIDDTPYTSNPRLGPGAQRPIDTMPGTQTPGGKGSGRRPNRRSVGGGGGNFWDPKGQF